MGVVYFELSMSLDGFVTGPNVSVDNPLVDGGEHLHDWMFEGKTAEQSVEFEEKGLRTIGRDRHGPTDAGPRHRAMG